MSSFNYYYSRVTWPYIFHSVAVCGPLLADFKGSQIFRSTATLRQLFPELQDRCIVTCMRVELYVGQTIVLGIIIAAWGLLEGP